MQGNPWNHPQLLGSQERAADSPTGLAAKDHDLRAKIASWNDGERVATVAEKCTNPVELDGGHDKKRRKIIDESESIRCTHSQGKTINQKTTTNQFGLHNVLLKPMIEQLEKMDKLKSPPQATTIEKENSTQGQAVRSDLIVSNHDDLISFEQELNGDYMKLLDLDDATAEKRFRMALEYPLSPTLPDIDLLGFDKEVELQMLGMPVSARNNAIDSSGELDKIPVFCVLFSDMGDVGCVTRMFCATRTCISHLLSPLQTCWSAENILLTLVSELDLVPREKVCVFFSLILHNFVGATCTKSMDIQSQEPSDTFCAHLQSVLLNVETRHLFAKVCSLCDLLGLSEDFLLHKKILLTSNLTSDRLYSGDSKIEILHQGKNIVLHHNLASANMVVAGSIVMASISAAAGLVDYLCDFSLKIIRMSRADCPMTLLILHTFAYVCGEEYFTNSNYHSVMKVVKFIVASIECSLAMNDIIQPGDGTWHQLFPCDRCPFAGRSICLDAVSSKLLEEVQGCTKPHNQADTFDSRFLVTVFSSLELLAASMSWDWVCDKVVSKLFEMLESCDPESVLSTPIVALLGDLVKLGVEFGGYDDPGVKNIIQQLSANLHRTTALKCNTLSIAIVHALIELHPNGPETFLKKNEYRLVEGAHSASDIAASDIITTMLSSLDERTSAIRPILKRVIPT